MVPTRGRIRRRSPTPSSSSSSSGDSGNDDNAMLVPAEGTDLVEFVDATEVLEFGGNTLADLPPTPQRRGRSASTGLYRRVSFKPLALGGEARQNFTNTRRAKSKDKYLAGARNRMPMDAEEESFQDAAEDEAQFKETIDEPPNYDDDEYNQNTDDTNSKDSTVTKIDKVLHDYSHNVLAEFETLRQQGVFGARGEFDPHWYLNKQDEKSLDHEHEEAKEDEAAKSATVYENFMHSWATQNNMDDQTNAQLAQQWDETGREYLVHESAAMRRRRDEQEWEARVSLGLAPEAASAATGTAIFQDEPLNISLRDSNSNSSISISLGSLANRGSFHESVESQSAEQLNDTDIEDLSL
jgi:hypothetical protein